MREKSSIQIKCANFGCPNPIRSDKYHPGRVRYCSDECRSQYRNKTAGKQDREKWIKKYPGRLTEAREKHERKVATNPILRAQRLNGGRNSYYKSRYGITTEQKEQRLAAQEFRCANPGCRSEDHKGRGWVSDHSHLTGKLRGELCNPCNVALGMAQDSCVVLEGLVRYLKFYE